MELMNSVFLANCCFISLIRLSRECSADVVSSSISKKRMAFSSYSFL